MNEKILSFIEERDLHCVLNKFCSENLDIITKTIYHERSVKNKGKSEWLHPDMVGFQLTTSNWDNNIIEVCKNFYLSKAVLYSFELKKSISMDTLREYYFQAVSNSSWANEGYLVTASLDENNIELISEIKRLVGAFGIGIIKLDILNPNNSSIVFPAKRRDVLDGETMNKLYIINPDYRDFIQDVTNSLQINKLVITEWDKVDVYEKLRNKIATNINNVSYITSSKDNLITTQRNYIDLNNDGLYNKEHIKVCLNTKGIILTNSKPIMCTIGDQIYTYDKWRGLVVRILLGLKNSNIEAFNNYLKVSKLLSDTNDYKGASYNSDLSLYVRPMDSNGCCIELQKILKSFDIDLNQCFIYYEPTNKK